jgi:hypothetical protein
MENLKVGFIGLGQRGSGLLGLVAKRFRDVDIVAVCDVYEDRVQAAIEKNFQRSGNTAKGYTDHKDLLADENVQIVIISASWEDHIPLAIESMRAGKVTALEVGGAYSVDDCWQLVRTWEETQVPFMFLENCCYGERELHATRLARLGLLGEIVYCHGSYCHDLRGEITGGIKNRHYRLRNYIHRNCDNYPTHNLGPIARLLNINRGNRMLKLVSMGSKSRGLETYVRENADCEFLRDTHFAQSDVVTTMITCADGSLITLKLDTTLPRAYCREFSVSGTKGIYSERDNIILTEERGFNHEKSMWRYRDTAEEYKDLRPKIWRDITEEEIKAGHGGMDTLILRSFFDAVRDGRPMPIDVYDAASWMVISCLTEASIANGGQSIDIPDFTGGRWIMREPEDVTDLT